jgi:hypothetical protein
MRGRTAALLFLAAALALFSAPRAAADVRIFEDLEEAVPGTGEPVLLVFFSTDCSVCYDDLFEARYLVERGGWPVTVVAVFSGLRDDLRRFLEKYAWRLPAVLDRRKILFRRFKVDMIPFKALLAGGLTIYVDDPYKDYGRRREDLEKCLRKLFSR